MKILITGAGGFVGKHLLQTLSSAGHDLIATYRREPPPHLRESQPDVRWVEVDLSGSLQKIDPVDVIIHTAAVHYQSRQSPKPVDLIEANIQTTLNLCEFAKKNKINTFIHFSTVTVYGNIQVPLLTEAVTINDPDFYGATKYLGERILKEYAKEFPVVVLRLPAILGPDYFVPWLGRILTRAFKNEPLDIFNGQGPFNNITDVQELYRLISLLLERPLFDYRIFNVAASEPIPLREAVSLLVELAGSRSSIREVPSPKQSFFIETQSLQSAGFRAETTRALIERYVKSNLVHRGAYG